MVVNFKPTPLAGSPARRSSTTGFLALLAVSLRFGFGFGKTGAFTPVPKRGAGWQATSFRIASPHAAEVTPAVEIKGGNSSLRAWPASRDPKSFAPDFPFTKSRFLSTAIACVATWHAHAIAKKCGPVLASSALTLAFSLASPGLGQAAFCGSFAGMSSAGVLTGWKEAVAAGVVVSAIFELAIHRSNKFLGMGGRLGFVAFLAVCAVAVAGGIPFFGESVGFGFASLIDGAKAAPLVSASFFAGLGSALTILLRESSDKSPAADPVRAASVVGAAAALLSGVHPAYGDFEALLVYGGAFTGMSLPSRLINGIVPGKSPAGKSEPPGILALVLSFAVAGALGGAVHALTVGWGWWTVPAGWGGKAGTCAFAGVLLFRGLMKVTSSLRESGVSNTMSKK